MKLPITDKIQNSINFWQETSSNPSFDLQMRQFAKIKADLLEFEIIGKVRTLEQEQQKKIREEEQARITGIIDDMIQEQILLPLTNTTILTGKVLNETKQRILPPEN